MSLLLALLVGCGVGRPEPEPSAVDDPAARAVVAAPAPVVPGWLAFVSEADGARRVCAVPAAGGERVCPEALRHGFAGPADPTGLRLAVVIAEDLEGGAHRERLAVWTPGQGVQMVTGWTGKVRSPGWAPDGSLLLVESDAEGFRDLFQVDPAGAGEPAVLVRHPAGNFEPSLGPQGLLFASSRDGNAELYRVPTPGADPVRLTVHPTDDTRPVWSPDGARYAWLTAREGARRAWVAAADGTGARPVGGAPGDQTDLAWSPDGALLALSVLGAQGGRIEVVSVDRRRLVGVLDGDGVEEHPAWSPDGRWLAFTCADPGRPAVCVATPKGRDRRVVDTGAGQAWLPRWLRGPTGP